MEKQAEAISTLQEDEQFSSAATNELNGSLPENNQYIATFDSHHINCMLTLRKKQQAKCLSIQPLSSYKSFTLHQNCRNCFELEKDDPLKQDELDNSLIFRPKNKRKQQEDACLHETPIKMDKRVNFLPFNPEKGKNQQFKVLTRKSQQYEPLISWLQSQNPANMTLPS